MTVIYSKCKVVFCLGVRDFHYATQYPSLWGRISGPRAQSRGGGGGGWVKNTAVFFFISTNADWLKTHCKSVVLSGCFYGDCELHHRLSVSLVRFWVRLLTRSPTGRAIRTEASLETISYERMKIFLSRRDTGGEALLVLFKYLECYHGDKWLSFIPAPRES